MIMDFGQYKGKDLADVPASYLEYLIRDSEDKMRIWHGELTRRQQVEEADQTMIERIAVAGYRALALKHHPDQGGTADGFRALQAAHEQLKMILAEVAKVKGGKP